METNLLQRFDYSELNSENIRTFPTFEALAHLSYTVYCQQHKSKEIYDISESKDKLMPLSDEWKLIGTAENRSWGDGYNGAAYYNESTKHIVVAHRGTELSNLGSLWTDVRGVTFNGYTSQMKTAYKFTRIIVDQFWECGISVTVTGHSLGGWLSQTTTFFMEYPDFAEEFYSDDEHKLSVDIVLTASIESMNKRTHHLHAVAFDSPGALKILENYLFKNIPRYSDDRLLAAKYLDRLDVTTFFSSPNVINSTNMHIGTLFMMSNITDKKGSMSGLTDLISYLKYTLDSHSMTNIVKFWQSESFDERLIMKVTDWPVGHQEVNVYHKNSQEIFNEFTQIKFIAEPVDDKSIRMSVFDRSDREFLEDIQYIRIYGIEAENVPWEVIFKSKDISHAHTVFNVAYSSTGSTVQKNIFDFFGCFEISNSQVIRLIDDELSIDFFIHLIKYFVRNAEHIVNLPKIVKEVISDIPKVYQAIYQGFGREYMDGLPQLSDCYYDIADLAHFFDSRHLRIFQLVAPASTLIAVTKIVVALQSSEFSFTHSENIQFNAKSSRFLSPDLLTVLGRHSSPRSESVKFNAKNSLFLSSDLLTVLGRHVNVSMTLLVKGELKLILIENTCHQIGETLKSLMENVLQSTSPFVKLILVTSKKLSSELCSSYCLTKESSLSDQSTSFQYLTVGQQTAISDAEISFQGECIPLKHLISLEELQSNDNLLDHVTLNSLLSQKCTLSFGGPVSTMSDFERLCYINRHFPKIKLTDDNQLFIDLKKPEFVLVISYDFSLATKERILNILNKKNVAGNAVFEWRGTLLTYQPDKHKVILVEYTELPPPYKTFSSEFQKNNLMGYWFLYDTHWYWQASFGRGEHRLKVEYVDEYDETEMLGLPRQIAYITDEPGMGKTTLLKYFAERAKEYGRESRKHRMVIWVNLESCKQLFDELSETFDDFDVANDLLYKIFDNSNSSLSSVGKCLFNYLIQQNGRVTIFFDGLDEISDEIQTKVLNVAKLLLNHTSAQMYIGARLHLRDYLESYFSGYADEFIPLKLPERIEFLVKFWSSHPDLQSYEKTPTLKDALGLYASKLLEDLQASLNIEQADSFIGVPLQLFMLGSLSVPNINSFYSKILSTDQQLHSALLDDPGIIFDNIFNLYQKFVEEKCRIALEDKFDIIHLSKYYSWHDTNVRKLHRKFAFVTLFHDESKLFVSNFSDKEIQVLLGVGILSQRSNSIQFIHRSLAEYFAADFIVSGLLLPHLKEKLFHFLRKNIFLPNFDKVRFFIDHFVSLRCDKIFPRLLHWKKEKVNLFRLLEDEYQHTEVVDLLGRNVLHYAVSYGDHDDYGILWILIQNQHLWYKKDVFGGGFLSYGATLPKLQLQFCHQTVDVQMFLDYFYPRLSEKVGDRDERLAWILWFSGKRVDQFSRMVKAQMKTADFGIEADATFFGSDKQIQKFDHFIRTSDRLKHPIDLVVVAMRGSMFKYSSETQFIIYTHEYLDGPQKYLQAFKIAIELGGEARVNVASQLYECVDEDIGEQMLNLLARKGFRCYKNCIDFIFVELERDLWAHCADEQKKLYRIASTTNFITLRRALTYGEEGIVESIFEFYQNEKDENIRKIVLATICAGYDFTYFDCDLFRLMWKFLPTEETREQVLKQYYNQLQETLIETIPNDFSLFDLIHESVGSVWQNKLVNDVLVKLNVEKRV